MHLQNVLAIISDHAMGPEVHLSPSVSKEPSISMDHPSSAFDIPEIVVLLSKLMSTSTFQCPADQRATGGQPAGQLLNNFESVFYEKVCSDCDKVLLEFEEKVKRPVTKK